MHVSQVLQDTGEWRAGRLRTLDVGDRNTTCISHLCVSPPTHFSLKPVDIPSFLCCCNANLSAPLKRGRQEKGGWGAQREREEKSTALRINAVLWKCERRASTQ